VAKTRSLRHQLFMPRRNRDTGRLELSICWSEGMNDCTLWGLCRDFFDSASPDPAVGRADGHASMLYRHGLSIELNNRPYPRHCDVINWPVQGAENEADEKAALKELAAHLASSFDFVARPCE